MSGATTAIMIGFTALSAVSSIQQGNAQAKATIAEGNLVAKNKAQEVQLKAARQQSSFLTSGLTLEGTPMSVIESTFNTGIEDINQIRSNYGAQAKNQIAAGRSAALGKIAVGMKGIDFGSIASSGSFNPITSNLPVG